MLPIRSRPYDGADSIAFEQSVSPSPILETTLTLNPVLAPKSRRKRGKLLCEPLSPCPISSEQILDIRDVLLQTSNVPPPCPWNIWGIFSRANSKAEKGPTTDYGSTMVQWMRHRRRGKTRLEQERPSPSYIIDMLPPAARVTNPADTIPAKHLHSSLNKIKHPVNVVKWTPEGRRLLTGSSSGEFTLWHGMGFNFETIMSAHESAIRAAVWSHSDDWLVSADQDGIVKYWQPNFNNVKAIKAHDAAIRDVAFSPTDIKFVTASDDATLKIWDFSGGVEESTLTGHGWDAKSVDWHPTKGLLVSGSKDHQVKLWDPRTGRCLTTLHGHKNTLSKTSFERTRGHLLATCARDQTARVFDLRMMRDVLLLKGHERDIMTLTWHPIHASMLSTGSYDGSLHHYLLDEPNQPEGTAPSISPYDSPDPANALAQTIFPAHRVPHAHEAAIWSLDWHPLGHILASGSNDRITRFWTRPRPGDSDWVKDRYHIGDAAAEAHGTWNRNRGRQQARDEEDQELEDEADGLVDQQMPVRPPVVPGLSGLATGAPQLPGMGAIAPTPGVVTLAAGPPPSALPPGMDPTQIPSLSQLAEMFGGKLPPLPPPGATSQTQVQFPPPLPLGFPPPPGIMPPGFPPPPGGLGFGAAVPASYWTEGEVNGGGVGGAVRKRAPLPSQQDSLREEMRRGNYRSGR